MLEAYLLVSTEHEEAQKEQVKMASLLKQLPAEDLEKLARFGLISDTKEDWLEKFKGTPLYDQALALEEEDLRLEMENTAQRQQQRTISEQYYSAQDKLCVQKRLLELQLRRSEAGSDPGMGEPEEEVESAPEADPPPVDE